jgi:hypothetical protein
MDPNSPTRPRSWAERGYGYRAEARFVPNWREHAKQLDRNARARIMAQAEALERRTKAPQAQWSARPGRARVLGALMRRFFNTSTGLCCPSYDALQEATGLCRQTIAHALARLERAGIIRIVRRLCRQWVERVNPATGQTERYIGTTQTTSLYTLHEPGAWADHLPAPDGRRAPFPATRQLSLLVSGALTWSCNGKLSLAGREEPLHNPPHIGPSPLGATLARLGSAMRERMALVRRLQPPVGSLL